MAIESINPATNKLLRSFEALTADAARQKIAIAADAPLGVRRCRVWTSQGAAPSVKFVVGDLPEIVEREVDGEAPPVLVRPPVTINGRIFPQPPLASKTGERCRHLRRARRL